MEFVRSHKLIAAGVVALLSAVIYSLANLRTEAGPSSSPTAAVSTSDGMSILPAEAKSFHELRAELDRGTTSETPTLTWSVNGQEVHVGPTLRPHNFRPGDTVSVRAEQTGPDGMIELGRASVVIPNTLPVIRVVNLQRDRSDATRLEALVGAADPDGDEFQTVFSWRVDGREVRGAQGPTLSLSGLDRGANITCVVTAHDPFGASTPFESRPFTIRNRAPELDLDREASMRQLPSGEREIRFGVRVHDPDGDLLDVRFPGAPTSLVWDPSASQVTWRVGPEATESRVQVVVSDGKGASVERDLLVEL